MREPLKSGLLAGHRASALCTCTLVPDFPVCSIMRLLHACWADRTITSLVAAGSSRSSLLTATRGSEGPMPVARLQECGIMMTQLQPNAAGPVPSDGCTLLLCCAVLCCAVLCCSALCSGSAALCWLQQHAFDQQQPPIARVPPCPLPARGRAAHAVGQQPLPAVRLGPARAARAAPVHSTWRPA